AAVQKILDEGNQLLQAKKPQEALAAADRALAAAREAKDATGEARAQRARGILLQETGRTGEALAARREAAEAWQRAGRGPGENEALASAALLLSLAGKEEDAKPLLGRTLNLGRAESKRPLAAAGAMSQEGGAFEQRGRLPAARELFRASLAIREKLVGPEGD